MQLNNDIEKLIYEICNQEKIDDPNMLLGAILLDFIAKRYGVKKDLTFYQAKQVLTRDFHN